MSLVPNLDYDGPSGQVELGADGDPLRARFDKWGFDDQGVDYALTSFPVAVTRT